MFTWIVSPSDECKQCVQDKRTSIVSTFSDGFITTTMTIPYQYSRLHFKTINYEQWMLNTYLNQNNYIVGFVQRIVTTRKIQPSSVLIFSLDEPQKDGAMKPFTSHGKQTTLNTYFNFHAGSGGLTSDQPPKGMRRVYPMPCNCTSATFGNTCWLSSHHRPYAG